MSNTKFPLKKILILVTMLAVPGLLYYLLQEKGKNRYRPLAFYGPKTLTGTFHNKRGKQIPDTNYHTLRDFKLNNQNNRVVSFSAGKNRITVANFFFTRCSSFCNDMNREMYKVSALYRKNPMVQFLSITVDPEYDTPQILSKYASRYNDRSPSWLFLTGDKSLVYKLAKEDFLVDAFKDSTRVNNFVHSPLLILIDPAKRIRGFYDSGSKEQVDKLTDEIKVLIAEELRNVKDR